MNEITAGSTYLKKPFIPESQMEALGRGNELWHDHETRMWYPENPLVPGKEGFHIRVETDAPLHPKNHEDWQTWLQHWAKVFGAGKVLSEGLSLPDMWQSFVGHSEYTPEGKLITDIIGRNPTGESWGKTAPFPDSDYDHRSQRFSEADIKQYGDTLSRFFQRYWIPELDKVNLFPDGLIVSPPGAAKFQEVYDRNTKLDWPWASEPLLVGDSVEIIAILVPHLKTGMHLMIGGAYAPSRPWRDLNHTLQMMATAEAAAQILERTSYQGVPIAASESIRATGSWFGGFMKLLENHDFRTLYIDVSDKSIAGRFKQLWDKRADKEKYAELVRLLELAPEKAEKLVRKWLKRSFRGRIANEKEYAKPFWDFQEWTMGLGFHPHLYVARFQDELIKLTKRPATEEGSDWEDIEVMDQAKRNFIRDQLNVQFPTVILAGAQGKIV